MYGPSGFPKELGVRLTGGAVKSPAQAEGMARIVVEVEARVVVVTAVVVVVLERDGLAGAWRKGSGKEVRGSGDGSGDFWG